MTDKQKQIDNLLDTECRKTGLKALMVTEYEGELAFTASIHGRASAEDLAKMIALACVGAMQATKLERADILEFVSIIAAYTDQMMADEADK